MKIEKSPQNTPWTLNESLHFTSMHKFRLDIKNFGLRKPCKFHNFFDRLVLGKHLGSHFASFFQLALEGFLLQN